MLEKELTKLGLSDKEAKVYLSSLELGPSPVQKIAQKANVNRVTTYVVIDSLMERGLISTYEENKRTLFAAEQPERLLDFLKNQETQVKNKIDFLKEKMPELMSICNSVADKPKVRYFEGVEGLRTVQSDVSASFKKGDEILSFLPYDNFYDSALIQNYKAYKPKRVAKGVKFIAIYTSQKGRRWEYEKEEKKQLGDPIYVDYNKYPFQGGMNIYHDNKILMIDYLGKTGGIVIENKTLAQMMRSLFKLALIGAKRERDKEEKKN